MTEKRDPLAAWPVIDGPAKGQRIACARDDFEVLLDSPMPAPSPARLPPARVRYYLHAQVRGGYAWSCAAPLA